MAHKPKSALLAAVAGELRGWPPGEALSAVAREVRQRERDERFMQLALNLASRGLGRTSPNPPVGALVVRKDSVVGRGYHEQAGAPHAEVVALRRAGAKAKGATLYVTLEPCAHFGRTPPCVDAILAAGIRRVVIGCRDPNPTVPGRGAERLRRAGIRVRLGVLQRECAALISAFRKRVQTGMPWVTVKLAASLDGRIATKRGVARWVTESPARMLVHAWRNVHDAVLIGCETVRRDDPLLTCRLPGGRDPVRVVLDGRLRIPLGARVVSPSAAPGTWILTRRPAPEPRASALRRRGAKVVELPARNGRISIRRALRALARRGISSVMIEGGATVATAAIAAGVVDRFLLFYAPKLVGGDGRPMAESLGVRTMTRALPLHIRSATWVGRDLLLVATPFHPGDRLSLWFTLGDVVSLWGT